MVLNTILREVYGETTFPHKQQNTGLNCVYGEGDLKGERPRDRDRERENTPGTRNKENPLYNSNST